VLFVEKVFDDAGLYRALGRREVTGAGHGAVPTGRKSQVQALVRSQPAVPDNAGNAERATHDYVHHALPVVQFGSDCVTAEDVSDVTGVGKRSPSDGAGGLPP
jgi:hypothetical protein